MPNQFPTTLQQAADSTEVWIDDVRLDRAANGDVKARAMFTAKKRAFEIRCILTAAERTTFEAFYNANRTAPFNFTWKADSSNPLCLFDGAPSFTYRSGAAGALWDVEFRVVEV